MIRRLAFLLTTAAIAAVFVFGCEKGNVDGYTWYRQGAASKEYAWFVLPAHEVAMTCGEQPGEIVNACAVQIPLGPCYVYSLYTEADARKFTPSGPLGRTTLFEHEVWDNQANPKLGHCAGFNHRERDIRRT